MKLYKRELDSQVWHWCPSCSEYPRGKNTEKRYVASYDERPFDGELCSECMAIEISSFS